MVITRKKTRPKGDAAVCHMIGVLCVRLAMCHMMGVLCVTQDIHTRMYTERK